MNRRFALWQAANNAEFRPGDTYHEYIIWIHGETRLFRKLAKCPEPSPIDPRAFDRFLNNRYGHLIQLRANEASR